MSRGMRTTRHQNQSKLSKCNLRLEQVRMKEQYLVDQINERYMMILTGYRASSTCGRRSRSCSRLGN